jgi:hypothetical protein
MPIGSRYRLIDTAGGEIGIVTYNTPRVAMGETVFCRTGSLPRSWRSTTMRSTAKRAATKPPSS